MRRDSHRIIDPRLWLSDLPIRQCSIGARGLAVDLACCMTQGEPYGHLTGTVEQFSRVIGVSVQECGELLSELEAAGVLKRTGSGVLYWPQMVQESERRAMCVASGRRGGNPNIIKQPKDFESVPDKPSDNRF